MSDKKPINFGDWKQWIVNMTTTPLPEVVHYEAVDIQADPWYKEMTGPEAYVPDFSTCKRIVMVCEDAERESIKWWKENESLFEGELMFKIKPNRRVDVMVNTMLPAADVALNGVIVYANWQLSVYK